MKDLIRPKIGSIVSLYPHPSWCLDGNILAEKEQEYIIVDWAGPIAYMDNGSRFYWNEHIGFKL